MVFLHIQKTGGTTLGTRLVNHIGKFKIEIIEEFVHKCADQLLIIDT